MRCPKCHYISFGSADRCRNCGYDFSLVEEAPPKDLPIHAVDEPIGPLGDLPLARIEAPPPAPAPAPRAAEPAPVEPAPPAPRPAPAARLDLPLFSGDDAPLVNPSAVPRAPLAVRRASPAPARPAVDPLLEEERLDAAPRTSRADSMASPFPSEADLAASTAAGALASAGARAVAGFIDLIILVAIDVGVVYFTLRVLGLPPEQIDRLPAPPLVAFLLLLNGGYLAIFTAAGGQTIGKMLMSIRVVPLLEPVRSAGGVALGTAVLRTVAYFASLLPAGVGFLPILFSADRRALHDRLAETRVVRA